MDGREQATEGSELTIVNDIAISEDQADNAGRDVIAVEELTFGYHKCRPVIEDVSLTLQAGRLLALIGPNAAGKSTLLRLMLGQLDPSSGQCLIDGENAHHMNARRRAAMVSYVPQHGKVAFAFTVEQMVAMGRYALPVSPEAVTRAMDQCDLHGLAASPFNELSAGQQQRVLIARAIAQSDDRGRAMLLDEPASNMDLRHAHDMMKLLHDLATRGLGVMVVLHDLNLAAHYADDVALLHHGKIVAAGPWQDVLRPEVLEPVYGVNVQMIAANGTGRPGILAVPSRSGVQS